MLAELPSLFLPTLMRLLLRFLPPLLAAALFGGEPGRGLTECSENRESLAGALGDLRGDVWVLLLSEVHQPFPYLPWPTPGPD
ncbi:hypothetical protein AB0M46_28600 [Dactylosporangium sp. NPDC051485]|uniref:hypothetical protein n=1 Tax=Dactylosporangium sp. NPDC051485 TaxID=3154846 RepID=UPI0034470256